MLSLLSKSGICQHSIQRVVKYSASRFFASSKEVENDSASSGKESKEAPVEKSASKKNVELPDFPEFPFIRTDFEEGIRSREYLKNRPTEKRIDMLKKEPGSVVYFDDDEFNHYFPHDFYTGFEKQKELTLMNTMQVRQEALDIMKKLNAFQNGEMVNMYPFLCLTGPRGSGKSMILRNLYYFCRRNNWITLYVPSARIWTHKGYQVIEMTRRSGGFFAQPEHCQKLLLDLHVTSGHLMKNIPLKSEFDRSLFWAKSQFGAAIDSGAVKSMNLDQLVLYGVNSARDSYEIAAYVKKELEQCTEYPVFIGIDDFNALYDYSAFEYRNQPIHARKLYLASLFRMFDEADYDPSLDKPYEEIRRKKNSRVLVETEEGDPTKDTRVCTYKNVLKNGIVVGACESRYDHFIHFKDVVNLGMNHNVTIKGCDFNTFNQFVDMFEKNEIIFPMTTPQREYVYAYTEGNYREMVWAILTNRRWMCDYTPKEDFFKWVEKSNNAELKKLWDYV